MKKKIIFSLVLGLLLLSAMAVLSGCDFLPFLHVHSYSEWEIVTPATCERDGERQRICSCGEVQTEEIPAFGHDLVLTKTQAATCTKNGSETFTCEHCGKKVTQTIAALGHTYNDADAKTTPATCTQNGKTENTCTRCGSVTTEVITALGHSFTNYETTDATCTRDSYKTAKCDRCDETDVIILEGTALGHDYGEDGKCKTCGEINPNLKVTSLEITNVTFLLETGKETQVQYSVYPANAIYEKVAYRIYQNNTCDATLTKEGILTCEKVGSVTVAVTIDDEITARATFYVPKMITTAKELYDIRNDLGGVYMLANDISLSEYTNWTPIGNATKSSSGNYDYTNAFSGKFDGGGHKISGLNINLANSTCSSLLTVGLFGSLSRDGQVSNVVLENVKITGTSNATDYVAMLVGFNPGSVSNCSASGTMTVSEATYVGGVIGENIGSAQKVSSDVAITVTGSKNYLVGGITGRTTGGQLSEATAKGSINVTSTSSVYVGGVVGNLVDKLATANAFVNVTVKATSSSTSYNYVGIIAGATSQSLSGMEVGGSIKVESYGGAYVGGIVGYSNATIDKCINNATISLSITNNNNALSYVGGIIGCLSKDVKDCTNNGKINVTQIYGGYVGGIAGTSGNISICKNNADIYEKSYSKTTYCGGIVGRAKSITTSSNNAKVNALVDASASNYVGCLIGYSEGTVTDCTNNVKGELEISYSNSSSSTASQYFGGVVGYGKSSISASTNNATVSAYSNGVIYCGGVVGYVSGNLTKVYNYACSLTINSGSTNSSYKNYVGGVVGYAEGLLSTAYNTANISVQKGNVSVGGVGGFIGGSTTAVKSIANVTVNNTVDGQNATTYVGGIIGNTYSSVTNCSVTSTEIKVNSKNKVYVGGITGNCDGTVSECYAYPNITVSNSYSTYVGGISGYVLKIVKSYSTSNVVGNTLGSYDLYVGGLSGYVSNGVEESYATGDINGTSSSKVYMAGLVGYVGSGATVTNCYVSNGYVKTNSSPFSASLSIMIYNGGLVGYNAGTISYSYAVNYGYSVSFGSSNSHSHYIGGLVAYNSGKISSCYVLDATDKLARTGLEMNRDVVGSGTAKDFYAGGFVGYNYGTVQNCYSDATVNTTVSGAYTGSFVGYNNSTIKNSIAYGEVNSGITGDTTGGFAGGGNSGYTACLFSKDTTLQTTAVGSGSTNGITASTNTDLRTALTFGGFSTTSWNIVDGTYPSLIFGDAWESRSDGFNKYNMLVNVPNKENQYEFPHSNRVTITFNSNSGEKINPIVVNVGDTIALPTLSAYESNGTFIFFGWCTDSECLNIIEEKTITVTSSQQFYAFYRQAISKPKATQYTFIGNKISVENEYKTNDLYTVSGTFDGTNVGEYEVVYKLKYQYCWEDGTISDYKIVWKITKRIMDIPNIYDSGNYVFYATESIDLSSKFGSEYYTMSGDTVVDKLDTSTHTITFDLKDKNNCTWSDSTTAQKTLKYSVVTGVCNADTSSSVVYYLENNTLTISGTGNMANYSSTATPWYGRKNEIKNVIISNGVTSIGSYAFSGCSSLTSITIPSSVKSIGSYAFEYCYKLVEVINLSSLNITKGSSSNGYVGYYALNVKTSGTSDIVNKNGYLFYTYSNVNYLIGYVGSDTALTLPENYNGQSYAIYNYAFYNCSSLTSVTIPSSVTSIGDSAFSGCSSLQEMTIPFVGAKAGVTSSDTYQYPFGYIFGTSSYTGGTATTQYYYGSSTSSTTSSTYYIPTSLKKVTVTGGNILYGAFRYCSSLTSITIPSSVTSIGDYVFYNCSSLESVTIPSSVTSIGDYVFYNCSSLESVTIPSGVTSIGSYAFYGCSSLESITIPSSVTSIGSGAFCDCSSLESVNYLGTIDDWVQIDFGNYYANPLYYAKKLYINGELLTTANITTATTIKSYAFYGCSSLESITIPSSVTSIGGNAFYKCSSLESITIPSSVTSIGERAFSDCSSLESITIPSSVTSIGSYAFSDCSSLTSITIPSSVTSIGERAFSDCSSLTNITIPSSVTSIGNYAFYNCSSLTSITIPSSVKSIGSYAFYNCYRLVEVINLSRLDITKGSSSNDYAGYYALNVKTSGTSDIVNVGGYLFYTYANVNYLIGYVGSDTALTLPENYNGKSYAIYKYAFYNCSSLESITIPSSVTSIGSQAFNGCSSLESVNYLGTIDDWVQIDFGGSTANPLYYAKKLYINGELLTTTANITTATTIKSYAFYNCSSLESITIPSSVTSIGSSAFYGCSSLKSITIPSSVTSIGDYAFYGCSSLKSITIPSSVTSIGSSAFSGCSSLQEMTIPFVGAKAGVKSTDTYQYPFYPFGYIFGTNSYTGGTATTQYYYGSSTSSTVYSYYIPTSLKKVTVTGGNILYGAFRDCTSLTSITIPDSVTSIGRTFEGCTSLTSITIPDSVTSIGNYAFYNCTSLTSVTIPNSVTSIGYEAFYNCTSLTSINFQGTKAQWNAISKGSMWNYNTGNYVVHCTDDI